MKKIILTLITALTLTLNLSLPGFAAESLSEATFNVKDILTLPKKGGELKSEQPAAYYNDTQEKPAIALALEIINFALSIMGSIALILMIVAGLMMMLSQGSQQVIDQAKEIFKFALIGLVVAFLSYIIVLFVQSIFISEAPTTTP